MSQFNLSFTAASLRPELARVIAETYRATGSWEQARERVLDTNALQSRSRASAVRVERELRQRLQTLTEPQLKHLVDATADDAAGLSWLATIKYNRFIFEFAAHVLRDKLALRDATLRLSDYEAYVAGASTAHPELGELTDSSRTKVRTVLVRMLREAGIVTKGQGLGTIHRPVLSPAVRRLVVDDDPRWLAGFLYPDSELDRP